MVDFYFIEAEKMQACVNIPKGYRLESVSEIPSGVVWNTGDGTITWPDYNVVKIIITKKTK